VGEGNLTYVVAVHGAAALAVMASFKRALEPPDSMMPGRIVALS
jgi:hypothetical protein